MGRSVTTDAYRYNSWEGGNGEELYDRANDPKKYTNLVSNPHLHRCWRICAANFLKDGISTSHLPAILLLTTKTQTVMAMGFATVSIRSPYQPNSFRQITGIAMIVIYAGQPWCYGNM